MNTIATLPAEKRQALFRQTAEKTNMTEQIVEKDFWVCWVLKNIFESSLKEKLIFKGGTSLSKVYGIIERFSEDIDLILNWAHNPIGEPMENRSKNKTREFNERLLAWSNKCIEDEIYPTVAQFCDGICKTTLHHTKNGDAIILILYPQAFPMDQYLRPEIKLEIGALAAWDPHKSATIVPYAAEQYPHIFQQKKATVEVTTAERTFWEKATILHAEAGRPEGNRFRERYARHYYDLVMMARNKQLKETALQNPALLKKVVEFKQRFYSGSAWCAYPDAKQGTFRLLPPAHFLPSLAKDYEEMKNMIYGEYPDLATILHELTQLQEEINKISQ